MFNTALVHEHEIAKHDDFQFAFESILRNTFLLDKILVSAEANYVIGGQVIAESIGSMNVFVRSIWAHGPQLDLPVYSESDSGLIFIEPPLSADRIDILEAQGLLLSYDEQRRAFFDPELENGRYYNVDTKIKLTVDFKVVHGEEGTGTAPPVDDGYVKLAEIILPVGESTIINDRIKNITALIDGEENVDWTNDKDATFYLGSLSNLKSMLGKKATLEEYGITQLSNSFKSEDEDKAATPKALNDLRLYLEGLLQEAIGSGSIGGGGGPTPFLYTFADLSGIELIQGIWDQAMQYLDCSSLEGAFVFTFENLNKIDLIHGVWNSGMGILEC